MGYLSAFAPILVYSYLRFFSRPQLLALFGQNGDYWFEVAFCGLALMLYWRQFKVKLRTNFYKLYGCSLIGGLLTLLIGKKLFGLVIPFQIKESSNILMLILWGPILEEFIFRFSLYWPLRTTVNKRWSAILTSLFFSYCHFHAYSLVPDTLKSFIIYQAIYTLVVGYWWVKEYQKEQNFLAPLGLHIFFNFGFYLGMILL